ARRPARARSTAASTEARRHRPEVTGQRSQVTGHGSEISLPVHRSLITIYQCPILSLFSSLSSVKILGDPNQERRKVFRGQKIFGMNGAGSNQQSQIESGMERLG